MLATTLKNAKNRAAVRKQLSSLSAGSGRIV
jgi:hypothetical protein